MSVFLDIFLEFKMGFDKRLQLVNDVSVLNDVLPSLRIFFLSFYGILGHFVVYLRHLF